NQLLPTVDLFAAYNQNGVGGKETIRSGFGPTAPIVAQFEGGIFDSFGQLFGYGYTGYSVGLSVQIPLRNRAEQGETSRAMTDELQAIVNYTKALVDIDRAMGMTLKKNNIEIEKTLISGPTAR